MEKKIILITGASSGIGKETAMTLARQGNHAPFHCKGGLYTLEADDVAGRESCGNKHLFSSLA